MLIGRDAPLARIDRLVREARRGRGDALLVLGEPGIGKSTLLTRARELAEGTRVITARGALSESQLAFAGLADLLRPLMTGIDDLPEPQAAALRGALAIGPPAAWDRFAAYTATLALVTRAARAEPLLMVVDDLHWLDAPSAEALAFCARRLGDDAVGLILAARPEELGAFGDGMLEELRLRRLAPDDARALLVASSPGPLSTGVVERMLSAAAGNPLALVELPSLLDEDERRGLVDLPEPLRPGEAISRAFGRRIVALPERTRAALLTAAALGDAPIAALQRAISAGDLAALATAEAAGVLVLHDDAVSFRHPLMRAVVLEAATPAERRAAHRAVADALELHGRPEARAWHLAAAALGPDEGTAAALDRAAGHAAARTGYAVAASALQRAAGLSTTADARHRRLVGAAQMAQAAGRAEWAVGLLDGVLADEPPPARRAEAAHLRGIVGMLSGPLDDAFGLLIDEASRAVPHDPARAALMLSDAVLTRTMAGDCRAALAVAERAHALAASVGPVPPHIIGYLAGAMVLRGHARGARALLDRFDLLVADVDPISPAGQMLMVASPYRTWLGDHEFVRRRMEAWIELGRASGAAGFLGLPLTFAGEVYFRIGRWDMARTHAAEAVRLLEETGQTTPMGYLLTVLGLVAAGTGQFEDARRHADAAAGYGDRHGAHSVRTYVAGVRGFTALSANRLEEVVERLQPLPQALVRDGLSEPAAVQWQPDLIEALVRLGRMREARAALADLSEQAHRTGGTWARAVTCRGRGLIDPDFDRHFAEALSLHAATPTPFERARTELLYGERLRRARRRTDARRHLDAALAAFEAIGAQPWAARAREELAALGSRAGLPVRAGSASLTARELQVAMAAAAGGTNAEVAARLFLSPKTVERHLGSVYRKLGLRSRTELAWHLAGGAGGSVAGDAPEPVTPGASGE